MPPRIPIRKPHDTTVGHFEFDEHPRSIQAERIPRGVKVRLPMSVEIAPHYECPTILVTDISGRILVKTKTSGSVEVGHLSSEETYRGGPGKYRWSGSGNLLWELTSFELGWIEKARDGSKLDFRVELQARISYILDSKWVSIPPKAKRLYFNAVSDPEFNYGYVDVSYPSESWVGWLKDLGLLDALTLEMPILPKPAPGWEDVWKSLSNARTAFEHGGDGGWKNAVVDLRTALEAWQKVDPIKIGEGFPTKDQEILKKFSKEERIEQLRWSLQNLAHRSAHSPPVSWSREEAMLVLATFTALLAIRSAPTVSQ